MKKINQQKQTAEKSADKNVNEAIVNIINILKDIKEDLTIRKREMEKYIKAQIEFIQMKICWMTSRVKNRLYAMTSKLDIAEKIEGLEDRKSNYPK